MNRLDNRAAGWLWAIFNKKEEAYYKHIRTGILKEGDMTKEIIYSAVFHSLTSDYKGGIIGLAMSNYAHDLSPQFKYQLTFINAIRQAVHNMQYVVPVREIQKYFYDEVDLIKVFTNLDNLLGVDEE